MGIRSSSRLVSSLSAAALASALITAGTAAHAHIPYFTDGGHAGPGSAFVLPDAEASRVLYAEVPCPNEPIWLTFEGEAGDALFVQLGVPVLESLRGYRPTLVVLGPGLPGLKGLPLAVPEGLGGVVMRTSDVTDPEVFHEEYTDTYSWILVEERLSLVEDGTHYIVALGEEDIRARLWVAVGEEERMEPSNVADPIQTVKEFHDGATAPELGEACAGGEREVPGALPPGTALAGGGCAVRAPERWAMSGATLAAAAASLIGLAMRRRRRQGATRRSQG